MLLLSGSTPLLQWMDSNAPCYSWKTLWWRPLVGWGVMIHEPLWPHKRHYSGNGDLKNYLCKKGTSPIGTVSTITDDLYLSVCYWLLSLLLFHEECVRRWKWHLTWRALWVIMCLLCRYVSQVAWSLSHRVCTDDLGIVWERDSMMGC